MMALAVPVQLDCRRSCCYLLDHLADSDAQFFPGVFRSNAMYAISLLR